MTMKPTLLQATRHALSDPLKDNVIQYMPGGTHQITPSQGGRPVTVVVHVDAASAEAVEEQRRAIEAQGLRPYFSIGEDSHASDKAAFWPTRFFWARRPDATGANVEAVWAQGEWSKAGREAVEGKDFRVFSPTFFVDTVAGTAERPSVIVCCEDAKANMGALVNDPAFKRISPLWAKNAGVPGTTETKPNIPTSMKKAETRAELQARNQELELTINSLGTKDDAISRAELRAARSEQNEIGAALKLMDAEEQNRKLTDEQAARVRLDAENAVQHMVEHGQISPRDFKKQDEWRKQFVDNPALIALQCGNGVGQAPSTVSAAPAPRTTPSAAAFDGDHRLEVVRQDPRNVLRTMAALCAGNAKDSDMRKKTEAAGEIGYLYKREISPLLAKDPGAIRLNAADYSGGDSLASNTLGILSGTLVAQRTLELYKYEFPMLSAITTDFSDEPAQFGQTTATRIIVVPAVLSYDPTLDSTGRPKGYTIATPAKTVDAPISLNKHRAVDIVFDANTLAATARRLFEEQAPAAAYALGLDIVGALYAVITPANFNSSNITGLTSGANLAQAAGNGPFQVPATSFGRPTFSKAKRILNLQGTPFANRFCLAASDYQEQLEQDPTLVSLAVFQKPEIITESQLPPIARFTPYEAPNLPATAFPAVSANSVLKAFFGHKSSLLMQARIPNDWTKVLGTGNSYGSVNVVTNPDTGLSTLLVQFSDPRAAYAEYRLAVIYGVAPGDVRGGQVVTN